MSLATLLNPTSVAVIGASQKAEKIGGRPIRFMKEMGFAGRIYPVNAARDSVQGLRCFPTLAALPEVPDVAIIALGREAVVDAVADCARRGVKACVIMSSGFGEADDQGKADEARLLHIAQQAGMRIVGPNSQGIANFHNGAILNFSTMFIEEPPEAGPVACISQSGAMSVVPYGLLRARGIGIGHCHATGNDSDVTVSELTAEVVLDPRVKLCLIYLETLQDPWNLALAARRARDRGVPIIALKSGRSPDGQRAAASHTGAIATEDRVIDAFFARHGIWRAEGTQDLVHAVELYLSPHRPAGRRAAIISNSGATCVLAADACARHGLDLAQLGPATEEAVRRTLPSFASSSNPIDLTAALLTDGGLFGKILPLVGQDKEVDLLMIGLPVSGRAYNFETFAQDTAQFMRAHKVPVALAAPQRSVRLAFADLGVPTFESEDSAIHALSRFAAHIDLMRTARGGHVIRPATIGPGLILDENASLEIIGQAGIATPRRRLCNTLQEVLDFLNDCPKGIALKANSPDVPHRSEHGLVRLSLRDKAETSKHFDEILTKLQAMGARHNGVLAAEMLPSGQEMVIGGHIDPVFGPVVVVGAGGVGVEMMPDNKLLLVPFDQDEINRALSGLRIGPLFDGVRGLSPLSRSAVVKAAKSVSALLQESKAISIDINPLIVTTEAAWAADALIVAPAST